MDRGRGGCHWCPGRRPALRFQPWLPRASWESSDPPAAGRVPPRARAAPGAFWTLWVGPQVQPRIAGGGQLVDVGGRTHPPGGRFRGDLGAFPAGWSPSPVRLPLPTSALRESPS